MYYALNLFDLEDEEIYQTYLLRTAGPIVRELGGELLAMGKITDEVP